MSVYDFSRKTSSSKSAAQAAFSQAGDLPWLLRAPGTPSRSPARAVLPWAARIAVVIALTFAGQAAGQEPDANLISQAHAAAQARGASAKEPIKVEQATLVGEKVLKLQFELKANACLVAAAAANESVSDAEVSLKAPGADWIADTTPGPVATLRYCAGKVSERVQLRARVPGKDASVALGAWPMRNAEESATAVSASEPRVTPSGLRRELAQLAAQRAPMLKAAAPAREEELGPADPRAREVSLEAGRCYRFLAVAGAPIDHLSLGLRDASGADVAAHSGAGRTIAMPKDKPFCPAQTATFTLSIEVRGGAGLALWQPFGGIDQAHEQRFSVGGEGSNALAKRVRDTHAALPSGSAAAMPFVTGTLATAERAEAVFTVRPGICYQAVAAGTASLRSLDLEIVDQRDNVIADARDQGTLAMARACASIPGEWRVRVRAFKGYGQYGVQAFGTP